MTLRVTSEIGRLRSVIMQPPGKGIERCTPLTAASLAWDSVPSPRKALEEHQRFVSTIKAFGTKVYLFEDLLRQTLEIPQARREIIDGVIAIESPGLSPQTCEVLEEYLDSLSSTELVDRLFFGMTKKELSQATEEVSLIDLTNKKLPWCLFPMTNVLFARDPAVVLDERILYSTMYNADRIKEPLCYKAVFTHHPEFKGAGKKAWYGDAPEDRWPIEGGNVHCYSEKFFVVGVNDRTSPESIERLARRTMEQGSVTDVLALMFDNPRMSDADPMGFYLHVDMFLNRIDHDAFLFYPYIENKLTALHITKGSKGRLKVRREDSLFGCIKKILNLDDLRIIKVGGENSKDVAFAEQRSGSGGNTVTLEPGKVCIWDRNEATIKALERDGISVVPIEADELVKGGGGPRCCTMPLWRDEP